MLQMPDEYLKFYIKEVYEAMDAVSLDALIIDDTHYSIYPDGEKIVDERIDKCKKDLVEAYKLHYYMIEFMKEFLIVGNSNDKSNIPSVVSSMMKVFKDYGDLIQTHNSRPLNTVLPWLNTHTHFLNYPSWGSCNQKKTYDGLKKEIDIINAVMNNVDFKETKFDNIIFNFRQFKGIPVMDYEQKYKRAVQSLKQFGLIIKQ